MSLFLCLSDISLGRHCWKRLSKSGGLEKVKKRGDGHIGGGGVAYDIERLKEGTLEP